MPLGTAVPALRVTRSGGDRGGETVLGQPLLVALCPRRHIDPVDLAIYNARGQRLTTLVQTIVAAGRYSVVWNGRDAAGTEVASGVYLYRLRVGSREESRKLLLVR